jgi:hypothetical protein
LAVIRAFERERAFYVVIGGLARVLQGADELTYGVDVCPSVRESNLERVQAALDALGAAARDRRKTPVAERVACSPLVSMTAPPAASTTACAAAVSHSLVGPKRG